MNPNATFGIAITADDKTAKGFNSAEKRGEKTASKIGQSNKAWAKAAQDNIGGGSRGLIGNLGRVEKAATRAFSGMSGLGGGSGGIIGQLGAVRSMAGLAGEGLGGAAGEAGLLEAGLIGVGGAAVATGAVVVGLAAGMVKLSDSWGKGANNLGNMASLIGVSTEGLQKFAGAAERVGVDKNTAMGTMGSLSQTLNDAAYGKNKDAMGLLGKLGVRMRRKADGDADVEAMLPDIANAITAQTGSGRRTVAHGLGISEGALAAFTQGGSQLKAGMDDYGRNGAVVTDADTKLGRALTERDTKATQWMGKGMLAAQRANAGIVKGAGDAIIGAANGTSPIGMPSLIGSADAQTLPAAGSSDAWGGGAGGGFRRSRSTVSARSIEEAGARLSHNARVHRNPGNVRPVHGGGFVTYPTYEAGIAAMAGQIRRDQTKHGAQTVTDVVSGTVGSDGRRHWGYAPPDDHNDSNAYIRNVARTMGVGPRDRINLSDPETLSRETYAHVKQENGHEVFSLDQIRSVVQAMHIENRIVVEDRRVTVHSSSARSSASKPAISHAWLP